MSRPDRGSVWYARFAHEDGEESLVGVATEEFGDGTVVDLSDLHPEVRLPPRWLVQVRHRPGKPGLRLLRVNPDTSGCTVPLWFVEHPEPAADPPAHTVVAFTGDGAAEGSVRTAAEVARRGLSAADQVGAVRWWYESGLVHQIYVQPARRREGIARALLQAAAGVRVSNGWASLHGNGQRTDLGELFTSAGPTFLRTRVAPRTHRLPPMTPGGSGESG